MGTLLLTDESRDDRTGDRAMIRIDIGASEWRQSGGTRARGYAYLDSHFLPAVDLAAVLDACATDTAWKDAVSRLNGCFAVVTLRASRALAAVDRIRSIPLFYAPLHDGICVSDSAYTAMEALEARRMNSLADAEFRLTGYVTGAETLCAGVFQIEAGESVVFEPTQSPAIHRHRYYDFRHRDWLPSNVADLISRLESVHANVFRRLVDSVDGHPIAVPLSGGYDSRLIGVSLRDMGARDVVCYSYGVSGNWESRISQELARYLGFRWEFVPYTAERWRAWAASGEFAAYFHHAGNLASIPHIQDWPAIVELRREARIPPDSVVVPGHSGDFLAGSHIPKSFAARGRISRREVLDALQFAHYSLWDWPQGTKLGLRNEFDRRIETIVGPITEGMPGDAADAFECWDLRERQAKFICNSVRVYESFGFDWRLPLFDHELMDFWARVPLELRIGRKLYFEYARQRQTLPITGANTDHGRVVQSLITLVDRTGMRPLARWARRLLRRVSWKRVYEDSPLAWLALIDRAEFRRTYTGTELMHSYLAVRYRDHADRMIRRHAGK